MTKKIYKTGKVNNTYGGELNLFDFEEHHTLYSMANRIVSDWRFDKKCRKNVENRDRRKNYEKGNANEK